MDRYYRAHCPHGLWVALLTDEAAQVEWVESVCPMGCKVILVTHEAVPELPPSL